MAPPTTAMVPWSRCFKVVSGQGSAHQSGKSSSAKSFLHLLLSAGWPPLAHVCALSLNYLGLDLILLDILSTNPRPVPFYIKHGRPA